MYTLEGRTWHNQLQHRGETINTAPARSTTFDEEKVVALKKAILRSLAEVPPGANCDSSVYTGGPGISLMFSFMLDPEIAALYLANGGRQWRRKTERPRHLDLRTSMLCGHSGVVLAEIALHMSIKLSSASQSHVATSSTSSVNTGSRRGCQEDDEGGPVVNAPTPSPAGFSEK
ncbi:unnamed protein product, partial [Amoebophrya sp. A25]|eukprot:GSA25T00018827001.1